MLQKLIRPGIEAFRLPPIAHRLIVHDILWTQVPGKHDHVSVLLYLLLAFSITQYVWSAVVVFFPIIVVIDVLLSIVIVTFI